MARRGKIVAGFTGDPDRLLEAGRRCREKGYSGLDAVMPYPVHGFEEVYALPKSFVPMAAKTMLVLGAFLGFVFQAWTSSIDWPVNIGGKPLVSWPAFIPVVFESGVLLAGLTTILALLAAARLFPGRRTAVLDPRLSNDRFAVVVPVATNGAVEEITAFLRDCGLDDVREYE